MKMEEEELKIKKAIANGYKVSGSRVSTTFNRIKFFGGWFFLTLSMSLLVIWIVNNPASSKAIGAGLINLILDFFSKIINFITKFVKGFRL